MTIADMLVPALQSAFQNHGLRLPAPPGPVAVFPAASSDVGDVAIYDDGDEATVYIGNITHFHEDAACDAELSEEERARKISDAVIEILRELFADRVLLWSIEKGRRGDGCSWPFNGEIPQDLPAEADRFVWSRKL